MSAFVILLALQFIITWLSVRSRTVRRLVKAETVRLLDRGKFLHDVLRAERVTESEVRAAIRASGCMALEDVAAVVLETDGSFSVMNRGDHRSRSALEDVVNLPMGADSSEGR